ncbi:MAG: hypothetical protein E7380_02065 [Clostridiales bacterium]|nr:hypothetical protein [Clostridiales bacterium]
MKKVWIKKKEYALNETYGFRYIFRKPYKALRLRLAAASTFRVFLNGEFLFAGPARSAHGYSIVHKKELCVKEGDVLCVDVCNYRINAYYPVNEEGFFACELYAGGFMVADAGDFFAYQLNDRIEKTQRINFQRSFTEAYEMRFCRTRHYLGEDVFPKMEVHEVEGNITIEADIPRCDWNRVSAKRCIESGRVVHTGVLHPTSSLIFDDIGEKVLGYKKGERDIEISDELLKLDYISQNGICEKLEPNTYTLYELEANVTGFIELSMQVDADCELYLTFDEIFWDRMQEEESKFADIPKGEARPLIFNRMHICNAVAYRLKVGEYHLITSEPYTLKYLKLICTKGGLHLKEKPKVILWQNDEAYALQLEISNKKLGVVFEAGRNTLAQNTVDVPTDCPGRERAGWLCDSYFTSQAETLLCSNNKCEENFFRAFLLKNEYEYIPEGMVPMCYPADHNDGLYIPNWGMWLVLEVANYEIRTENGEWKKLFKDKFYRLLDYFEKYRNEDGLLENLDGWVFVEWSKCADFVDGINYPTNMLYAKMLQCMATMYEDKRLEKEYARVVSAIVKQSYDGEFFREHAVRKDGKIRVQSDITETCQYYAFAFGIATKKGYPTLYKRLFTEIKPYGEEYVFKGKTLNKANSFIGNFTRFLYLSEHGLHYQLLEELIGYFYPMALQTNTLWEKNHMNGSLNHGFTAIVSKWILEGCGYFGYNAKKKCAYISPPSINADFCITVPLGKNKNEKLILRGGKGEVMVIAPEGITTQQLRREAR